MNDYNLKRGKELMKEVEEMLKNPYTREEAIEQVIRLFEHNMELTPEEDIIWKSNMLTKHKKILAIKNIRAKKERINQIENYYIDNTKSN